MTEQEIIKLLKENVDKGIASGFLPEEVRAWAYIAPISIFRFFDGKEWIKSEKPFIRYNDIICLPENYELKKLEKRGEWVEFDINENGCYRILDTDMRFHWSEWNKPLWIYEKDENRSWYLTVFGGWQYKEEPNLWVLCPMIGKDDTVQNFYGADLDVKQAIPVKIRFWREYK